MATNYERGRQYEYRSMRWLEKQGYTCFRTAGSHGECDVIALSPQIIQLVQVKFNCAPTPAEVEQFELLAAPRNTVKVVHVWRKGARHPELHSLGSLRREAA